MKIKTGAFRLHSTAKNFSFLQRETSTINKDSSDRTTVAWTPICITQGSNLLSVTLHQKAWSSTIVIEGKQWRNLRLGTQTNPNFARSNPPMSKQRKDTHIQASKWSFKGRTAKKSMRKFRLRVVLLSANENFCCCQIKQLTWTLFFRTLFSRQSR